MGVEEYAQAIRDAEQGLRYVPQLPSLKPDRTSKNRSIFVAFQREHLATATEFKSHLLEQGFHVFMYDPQILWKETIGAITDRIRNARAFVAVDIASTYDASLWLKGEMKYAAAYLVPIFTAQSIADLAPVVEFVRSDLSDHSKLTRRIQEHLAPHRYILAKGLLLCLTLIMCAIGATLANLSVTAITVAIVVVLIARVAQQLTLRVWPEESFHKTALSYVREEVITKACFSDALAQSVQRADPEYVSFLQQKWTQSRQVPWMASARITELFGASHRFFDVPNEWTPPLPSIVISRFGYKLGAFLVLAAIVALLYHRPH